MLSPWKKKKSAKPQTTEVQMMQSSGMSLILSPLRSWEWGWGRKEQPEGQASPNPFPALPQMLLSWCLPGFQEVFLNSYYHLI